MTMERCLRNATLQMGFKREWTVYQRGAHLLQKGTPQSIFCGFQVIKVLKVKSRPCEKLSGFLGLFLAFSPLQ
jgi:hypothetical protein